MAETQVKEAVVPKEATAQSRPDLFGTRGQLRPDGDGGILSAMLADKPEYATPEVSQVEKGFYVGDRGLPWHVTLSRQLGTPELMQDAGRLMTVAEAIDMFAGFEVEMQDCLAANGKLVPNKRVTVRMDTGEPLGVVGPAYKLHSVKDAFGFADNLVDDGQAKYETGAVMRGGAWVFLSMELDHLDITVPGDPSDIKTFLVVSTSFDGSRHTEAHVTRVRTVCRNTFELGKEGALSYFRIKHLGSLEGKLAEARKALGIAFKNTEYVNEITRELAGKKLVEKQIREIFETAVWPIDPEASEATIEKSHARLAFENYLNSPTLEGIRGTAWGAYNAVTEYLDHEVTYKSRTRGSAEDARADSLLFGRSKNAKDRALSALLKAK